MSVTLLNITRGNDGSVALDFYESITQDMPSKITVFSPKDRHLAFAAVVCFLANVEIPTECFGDSDPS